MISSIFDIMGLYRKKQEINLKVFRTKIGNYTIDSCNTFDAGYETAIWFKDNPMIIVENYNTYEECKKGHKKWCKFCEFKPKSAFSVQLRKEINFEEE